MKKCNEECGCGCGGELSEDEIRRLSYDKSHPDLEMSQFGTGNSKVEFKHGTYGPRHDPYAYEEIIVTKSNGDRIVLHKGMDIHLEINGEIVERGLNEEEIKDIENQFIELTGLSDRVLNKLARNRMEKCHKCGSKVKVKNDKFGETTLDCPSCGYKYYPYFEDPMGNASDYI